MKRASPDELVAAGSAFAMSGLRKMKPELAALSQEDRVAWWSGFLATAAGCAGADMGADAAHLASDAIQQAIAHRTRETRQ